MSKMICKCGPVRSEFNGGTVMTEDEIEKEVTFLHEAWINRNRKYVVDAIINRMREDTKDGMLMLVKLQRKFSIEDSLIFSRILSDRQV